MSQMCECLLLKSGFKMRCVCPIKIIIFFPGTSKYVHNSRALHDCIHRPIIGLERIQSFIIEYRRWGKTSYNDNLKKKLKIVIIDIVKTQSTL